MPIRPENKKLYPKDWKAIRARILERAKNCCEFCDVPNHVFVERWEGGYRIVEGMELETRSLDGLKTPMIVLTIAHLDHDPTNNDESNLKALCQKCHNSYDRANRNKNRKANRYKDAEAAGQMSFIKTND